MQGSLADSNAMTGQEASRTISAIRSSAWLRAQPEPDECYVRTLPLGGGADFLDVDLTGDHFVAEPCDDPSKQLEPLALLVCDQDA